MIAPPLRPLVRSRVALFVLTATLACAMVGGPARAMTDAELRQNDRAVEGRRRLLIAKEVERPFPKLDAQDPDIFDLGHLNASLAAFEGEASPPQLATANSLLADVLGVLAHQPLFKGVTPYHIAGAPADDDLFHFELAQDLFRIARMYGHTGTAKPGSLSPDNERRIDEVFFDWARTECRLQDPQSLRTWVIWGSENHGAQRDSSCWGAAALLAADPVFVGKAYADGSTPTAQLTAWTRFLRLYLSERARHGTLMEYFSPTYAQYTLNNFYLYADFSADPELKRLAKASLDLWWALWAQEEVDGIHGGSKTRSYAKSIPDGTPMPTAAWLYFGLGTKPAGLPPGEASAFASDYRPPAVVADLAIDAKRRGSYDVLTRAPGLAERPMDPGPVYYVDSQHNGVLRVAHVTPDYVMGIGTVPLLPDVRWTAISTQNRWAGLVFSGGDPLARIVPAEVSRAGKKEYNALFGLQSGSTQLIRSVATADIASAGQLRVWFGKPVRHEDLQGWVAVDAAAYVAVRPTTGGWHWDAQWMVPDDPAAAIVIQAADKVAYADLPAFITAVAAMKVAVTRDAVAVTGLGAAGTLSLGLGASGRLDVGDQPVNLEPGFVLKSPFVNEAVGTGKVVVQFDGRDLTLEFPRP